MNRKVLRPVPIIIMILAVCSLTSAAQAQSYRRGGDSLRVRPDTTMNRMEFRYQRGHMTRSRFSMRFYMGALTDEQQAQVQDLISEMREAEASMSEINTAVTELISGWGIEYPDRHRGGDRHRSRGSGFMDNLTEQQRAEMNELLSSLREEGASREEISEALADLRASWENGSTEDDAEADEADEVVEGIVASNYPNPFNPSTTINYTLGSESQVNVSIYNVAGQLVRSYDMGYLWAGTYSLVWDGTSADGASAPSGIYFLRIQAGNDFFTQRMLLMK